MTTHTRNRTRATILPHTIRFLILAFSIVLSNPLWVFIIPNISQIVIPPIKICINTNSVASIFNNLHECFRILKNLHIANISNSFIFEIQINRILKFSTFDQAKNMVSFTFGSHSIRCITIQIHAIWNAKSFTFCSISIKSIVVLLSNIHTIAAAKDRKLYSSSFCLFPVCIALPRGHINSKLFHKIAPYPLLLNCFLRAAFKAALRLIISRLLLFLGGAFLTLHTLIRVISRFKCHF